MTQLAESLSPTDLRRAVPACPSWTVFDLIAHVVSMPAAIGNGESPAGTITEWLQSLVEARRDQSVNELTEEWDSLDGAISAILNGPGGVLFGDLAVHEHDLRGAVGAPEHSTLEVEVVLPRTLAGFAKPLRTAGLGAIEVCHVGRSWRSHDSEPGWTLDVTPWEAVRAVNSRRTADELRGGGAVRSAQGPGVIAPVPFCFSGDFESESAFDERRVLRRTSADPIRLAAS
jgi:Mycothiol maleylpyruvate isomerase N-terminal domain